MCRVAGLASQRFTPGIERRHSISELVFVHVFVAGCAAQLTEMVRYYLRTEHWLVAFVAGHRQVTAREWKLRILMLLKRVARRLECRPIVALLAAITPWVTRELALMFIAVTVNAGRELDLEFRCRTCRYVASGATHVCMRKVQRETGLRMVRD